MIGKAVFASLDLGRHDVLKDEYQIKTDSTQPICSKPQDIILITLMDLWLDNRDRKVTNSNLLLNFSDDFMYVFDHYDCFGGTRQIGNINVKSMIQSNGMFIESNLGQYFLKLTSKSQFDIIVDKFILDKEKVIEHVKNRFRRYCI